ncbi:MAG: alpha/beta hydrolase, partial [Eubacterium sp.]|nr:alpha/beta hydrolase [Eubacterium sp.]
LLHGNGQDSSYFKNQIDYFSNRYRVIALDTRGHGKSPRGTKPFTIEQFSCDLNEFMEGLEIPYAVILGFSDGANIAMKFAIKYSNKVKALILNGGNLNPKGVKRSTQIPIEIGYKIARRFASKSSDAKKNTEMLGLMVNEPNIGLSELSKITAPTLVICGRSDMIKEFHTKEIAENIPNAKLSIIKGDHFIANKRYVTFNKEVEDFLQTVHTSPCHR